MEVVIETELGNIDIAVDVARAPASARAFLALVDDGSFTLQGTFYRTVRSDDNDSGPVTIDVVQGGLPPSSRPLPGIEHETTAQSGLRHRDGTISLARGQVGTATGAAFFICIGDQPELDCGGRRNADGQGFAAFGQVLRGMDVVRAIHRQRTSGAPGRLQMLDPPVSIVSARRR